MYSQNDWRNYQEYNAYLEHALKFPKIDLSGAKKKLKDTAKSLTSKAKATANSASSKLSSLNDKKNTKKPNTKEASSDNKKEESKPAEKNGKWKWPEGKNSKEYNHWYYENFTKFRRIDKRLGGDATDEEGNPDDIVFMGSYAKRWSEMTDLEKKQYMDEKNKSNISELFISQFLTRPLSLLSGDVNTYVNAAARDFLATYAYAKTAKQTVERKLSFEETDKETGFKKKSKEMSREDDLNQVNPGFYNWDSNSKNNCMLCTTTYDLRRRGYDVTAETATEGFSYEAVTDWYPDAKIKTVEAEAIPTSDAYQENGYIYMTDTYWENQPARAEKNANKLISELEKQPDGARGNLMVQWAGFQGGHSMVYEIVDGEVMILDGQSNKIYDDESEIKELLSNCDGELTYARLDNCDINPEVIKRASKS